MTDPREAIVRELAREHGFECDCGEDNPAWKAKCLGKMYNTESGHAMNCQLEHIADIYQEGFAAGAREQREGPRFEAGIEVYVDCPQYHGKGIVVSDPGAHNRWVSVRLENGNTWQYPYEAIRRG